MSNTLGGVNLTQIAQKSLDVLMDMLAPLQAFATDFSDEVAVEGSAVTTRVATQPTSGDLSGGYAAAVQNVTTTAKTITLGDVTGTVIGFTDSEWSKSSINLADVFVAPGVNAIADDMFDDALALLTIANYSTGVTIAAAAMEADKAIDIAKTLTDNKVPKRDRFIMLNSGHYAALAKSVKNWNVWGGQGVITENQIPKIAGMSVYEVTDMPGNSINLVGFAGGKQGIILAARVPAVPDGFPGEITNVTDPETGFTLQLRKWYSADDGKHYLSMGAMWGVAVGSAGNICRIVSA